MVILNLMSLFVAVEEVADRLVAAGIPTQRFVPVRIRHRPAVEYEATSIAGLVLRQPALVREGCDGDFHLLFTLAHETVFLKAACRFFLQG